MGWAAVRGTEGMMGYEMRVGDADREATAAELREHYASGRLTLEELNQRLDQALAAKTRADLTACMRDLPPSTRSFGAQGSRQGAGSGTYSGPGTYSGSGAYGRAGAYDSGPGSRSAGGWQRGHGFGVFSAIVSVFWALLILGMVVGFGFGGGRERPIAIIIGLFALAMLRRLFWRRRRRGFARRGRW